MRIRICLLAILTGVLPGWAQSDPPAEVTVSDAALRAVLEDSLGLAVGAPILATDLAELTELEARDAGILDLTGLEHATGPTPSRAASRDTVQALSEPVDSLTAKETSPSWVHNRGYRLLAKVGAGIGSGVVIAGMAIGFAEATVEPKGSPHPDTHRGLGLLLFGANVGCSVGFPFGVSAPDPHDSLPVTLLAGVTPGLVGFSLLSADQQNVRIGFLLMYIGPVVGSLIASEIWRKAPQDPRVSFGMSPTPDGGPFASATLCF